MYITQRVTFKNSIVDNHLRKYPTPVNISYFWGFGFLAGMCLSIQIITGLFLAMHYCADTNLAFISVEHIMRDVNYGWLFRYAHANGASFFLGVLYMHIGRGIYFKSYVYPRAHIWLSGMTIFVLVMAAAFIGYVLPWGQMSFWGATVITNFVTAIPVYGNHIAMWVWGGYGVDNATLVRFFALHFLVPFIIAAFALLHILVLHTQGSSNPLGETHGDVVPFYRLFLWKDLLTLLILIFIYFGLIGFSPNLLGHTDNYIMANPLVTPAHIVPEWYFLPFYAILRCIPSKVGGVLLMGAAIGVVFALPAIDNNVYIKTPIFLSKWNIFFFWLWVASIISLGILGGMPVEDPYILFSRLLTFYYFIYILVVIPMLTFFSNSLSVASYNIEK